MTVIVWAVILVASTATLLAALVLLAERYLTNYGQCKIDINQGRRTVEVRGGETLLSTLRNQDIFIPSACGGKGTCALCKVKVLDGGGPHAPTETPLLSPEEIAHGVRISCQCKVRNDMQIMLPEEMLSVREYRGRVERIRDLTHDIKELRIKLVEPEAITFRPGQFVQLETPAYGRNPEPVFRAYSISSMPQESGYLELIIRLVPGGICTTWVFQHLKEGDEVSFAGPFGEFGLSDTDKAMVWIAGGSGMAPFWSLVRHMQAQGIARPTTYFFGAVKKRDLFLVDELRQLEKELPWFRYVPALSAPDAADNWDGEKGLITEVVGRHVQPGQDVEGYLCGSPGMIDAAIKVLHERGVSDDKIFYDKFA